LQRPTRANNKIFGTRRDAHKPTLVLGRLNTNLLLQTALQYYACIPKVDT
jgi:hypothetical protein